MGCPLERGRPCDSLSSSTRYEVTTDDLALSAAVEELVAAHVEQVKATKIMHEASARRRKAMLKLSSVFQISYRRIGSYIGISHSAVGLALRHREKEDE